MLRLLLCDLRQRTQQCKFVGVGVQTVFEEADYVFEVIRNQLLVVTLPWYDMPNATSGVRYVSSVSRHHVNVGVHNGLS